MLFLLYNYINHPKIICFPHLGASTEESEENCAVMAARQVQDFLETGNIKNSVNFPNASIPYTGKRRVTAFHLNVPNMVGQITQVISTYQLNIADMVNRSRGDYAYTMIDIDNQVADHIIPLLSQQLKGIDGIVTMRVI